MKPVYAVLYTIFIALMMILGPPWMRLLLFIAIPIDAYYRAKKIELQKYEVTGPGTPVTVAIACLLLWFVFYPWFLINKYKIEQGEAKLKGAVPPVPSPANAPIGGTPASSRGDTVAQLEKLADLKAKGLLSDEEFAEQKKRLLDTAR